MPWIMRPRIGITVPRKRCVAAGSMACSAASPRAEMARLIERACAAALLDGRRMSAGDQPGTIVVASDAPARPSYMSTCQPNLARAMAARQPTGPAPATTALRDLKFVEAMVEMGSGDIARGVFYASLADDRIAKAVCA